MPIHNHLKLYLLRLKGLQSWEISREGLVFLFPRAGAGEYVRATSTEPAAQGLAKGDVMVILGGSKAKVRAVAGAEFAFQAFSVSVEHLFPIFGPDEIALVRILLEGLKIGRFHAKSEPATSRWHQLIQEVGPECGLEHRSQLLHVASSILSQEFKRLHPPHSQYEGAGGHVTRLFEQLSVDQILDLSVSEMARRFGCSQRHLSRLFNEHFGVSVGVLRMEMRLLKAVQLLHNPDFTIARVAKQCGFNHLGLFNGCFKRRFGVSPGQWRKNAGREEGDPAVQAAGTPRCRIREFGLCPLPYTPGQAAESRPIPASVEDAAAVVAAAKSSPSGGAKAPSHGPSAVREVTGL